MNDNNGMIKKEDLLKDIFEKYPKLRGVYIQKGFGCVGCLIRKFETVEESCKSHNIKDIDAFVQYLNKNK